MLKHLSVSSSHSGEIKAQLVPSTPPSRRCLQPTPLNLSLPLSLSLSLALCLSMSHGPVTYLVPALRISTPPAIRGIRKLLARNSIGVHSNSRIPSPLLSSPEEMLVSLFLQPLVRRACMRTERRKGQDRRVSKTQLIFTGRRQTFVSANG